MNVRTTICLCAMTLGTILCVPQPAPAQIKSEASEPAGNLAFARFIALIRGHLLAGDELVKKQRWNVAYPHFTFPIEEIYGVIRDELHEYRTPPFDGALKALARAVKARNAAQYPKALEKVEAALAAADAALKARQGGDWPRFTVVVAVEVLKAAADEYDAAVANGRIVHPIGYRTARGFILKADAMLKNEVSELGTDRAAALVDIRGSVAQLELAFASQDAPRQPPMEASALEAAVAQIASAAAKLPPTH
jgi:hypothetical protein